MFDTPEDSRLPEESESQKIGQDAVLAFRVHRPRHWRPKSTEGDDDFGLDMQVQVVDNAKVVGLFHAQIKGSRRNLLRENGTYYSVSLKTTTLNYYARIQDPIMLVFADLSSGEDPRDCPVFWTWISEEIHNLLDDNADFAGYQQDSFTFRVPATNIFSPDLNILPDLQRFRRRVDALRGFLQSVESSMRQDQSTIDAVGDITSKIRTGGSSLLAALTATQRSPWIEPQTGTLAASLRTAHQYISDNDEVAAQRTLDAIQERITSGSTHERAEYQFLTAKLLSLQGNDDVALDHFRQAHKLYPKSPKYLATFIEAQFKHIYRNPDDVATVQTLLDSIPNSDDPKVIAIKARMLAVSGAYDEATQTLSAIEPKDAVVARALISYLKRRWHETISSCDDGIPLLTESKSDLTILHILKARALFYLAIKDQDGQPDSEIPPFGLPDMDLSKLWEAWREMQTTLDLLRESGWPPNAEYLIDVLGATGVVLNRHREILGDLRELSRRRPHIAIVHEQLHRLATLAGEHELALEALRHVQDEGDVVRFRILALYEQHRYKEALEFAKEKLLTTDPSHRLHGPCLGVAALCAELIVKPDEAMPFVEQLLSRPEWTGDFAVYEFVSMCNTSPLRQNEAVNSFIAKYREHPNISIIQDNLFLALNAQEEQHARLCCEIGKSIRSRRRPALREVGHLAQAYVTLSDWHSAIALVNESIAQYGDVPRLLAIKAIAFDGLGNASGALDILEHLVSSQPEEDLAINSYVNICARNGFHQQAVEQLERLLERADSRESRLSYLQQLFGLEMSINPTSDRLQEIAWRYGQLADRTVEEQEGVFLPMFLTATLSDRVTVMEARQAEFCARVDAFFQRFPRSKILRRFQLSENASAADLKRALSQLIGMTPERDLWFRKIENQLQRGELAAPFCWRPQRLLRNITDIVHLWRIAQNSAKDAHAYHLIISAEPNYEEKDLSRGLNRPPLIDLISLLVLHDLGLIELLFRIFPTIAISKETLREIQRLIHPFPWGYTQLIEIRDLLRAHIHQVLQPESPTLPPKAKELHLDRSLEEIKDLVSSGQYSLYTDDAFARAYAILHAEDTPTITTIDVLMEAERREWLSVRQVSAKLALLAKWNVGIPVKARYFLAAIPSAVENVADLEKLIDVLRSDDSFGELAKGVWNFRKNYIETFKHIGGIIAYIAQNHEAAVELLAAVWSVWLEKVQFRTDIPGTRREHLAYSLIKASALAQEDKYAIKHLWDAYILLIAQMYGSQMDIQREREARQFVGKLAAQIIHRNDDENLGEKLFQLLLSGFESGTSEYDRFREGYQSERIRLLTETRDRR